MAPDRQFRRDCRAKAHRVVHRGEQEHPAGFFHPPTRERGRVVYLQMTEGSAEAVIKAAGTQDFVLVVIEGVDWIRELSPWKHEKVFAKGEDFAGGGFRLTVCVST